MKTSVALILSFLAAISLSTAQTSANGPSFAISDEADADPGTSFAYELFYSNLDRLQETYRPDDYAADLQDLSSSQISERTEVAMSAYQETDAELT